MVMRKMLVTRQKKGPNMKGVLSLMYDDGDIVFLFV